MNSALGESALPEAPLPPRIDKQEDSRMPEDTSGASFFAGFLVGALAGAAAALLLAPQSGEETRTLIKDKGIELKYQADDVTAEARRRAESLQTQAKEKAAGLQSQVRQAVDEGKLAAKKSKEDMLSQVSEDVAGEEEPTGS